jgi:hypothetical protein
MKSFFFPILFLLLALRSEAESVQIGTDIFHRAYTNSSSTGSLQEYCLSGETVKDWTKLFAIRQFKNVDSPKDYITRMADDYHKKLPWMTYASGGEKAKNRWFIDFLMYEKGGPKVMEWNFFRAETNSTGGVLVYQYAERKKYKKSVKELDNWDIKSLRKRMLSVLMTNEFHNY